MANRGYGYQYETSPRKLEPDYKRTNKKRKKAVRNQPTKSKKQNKKSTQAKKKYKMSFEMKFFIHSMLFFSIIFAIIASQALVEQRYKEKEKLKQQYDELLSSVNMAGDLSQNVRAIASEYGMQTKSATLINLETSDYIEPSASEVKLEEENFWEKIIDWIKEKF